MRTDFFLRLTIIYLKIDLFQLGKSEPSTPISTNQCFEPIGDHSSNAVQHIKIINLNSNAPEKFFLRLFLQKTYLL